MVRHRVLAIVLAAILFGVAGLAPPSASAADPQFPTASRLGLVPPPGFVPSTSFPGFMHNDKQASILLAELPANAYDEIEKEISAELERNPAAGQRQEIELKSGGRGFILSGSQTGPTGQVLKWTMFAKANDVTAAITALVPEAVKEVASDEAIRASLATLTVRATVPVEEQLAALPFSMHELAGFRIIRLQPHAAVMLTDGPKDSIEAAEQPLLLLSLGPMGQSPRPEERDGVARRMIGQTPGLKEMRVVRSEPLRIANQQGHEVLMEAKDAKSDHDVKVVQWLRFGSGTLLRIVGIARTEGWDDSFSRFRKIRDGIGPK